MGGPCCPHTDVSGGPAVTPTLLRPGGLLVVLSPPSLHLPGDFPHPTAVAGSVPTHQTPGLLLPSSTFLNNFWKGHGFSIHTNRPPPRPSTH